MPKQLWLNPDKNHGRVITLCGDEKDFRRMEKINKDNQLPSGIMDDAWQIQFLNETLTGREWRARTCYL